MAKYGPLAKREIKKVIKEHKYPRKQALAIALNKTRRKGGKVPKAPDS